MKRIFLSALMAASLQGFTQTKLIASAKTQTIVTATGTISGTITTIDKQPAAMVTVAIKNTGKVAVTNEQGHFTLSNISQGACTLKVSMVGIKTQERMVEVKANETSIVAITLAEDAQQLSEVLIITRKSLNEKITAIGKIPVPPRDLPQAIMVIDKSIIDRQQVQSMSDALQNVSGVYIMGTTGGFQEEIAARGYAFGSNNTFKNGARFNNGIKPEFSSVEKIEVLKGGNAILYGNVGAGGILNMITKKPKFEAGGEISFRAGSYDFYKPSFDIYGPFSKSSKAAFRLNGSYEKAGSFRDVVTSERTYFNPSFLLKAGAKTEIILEGDYLKDNRTPDYGVGAINYTLVASPRSRFLNVPWAYNATEQGSATATVSHQLSGKVSLHSVVAYQHYTNELYSAARPASTSIAGNGTWARGLQKSGIGENYYFASLDLNAKLKTGTINHTILFGGDADKYKTITTTFATYANAAISNKNVYDTINIFNPATSTKRGDVPFIVRDRITASPINRYGIYVQDLATLLPSLKVLAGVRYSFQANERSRVDTLSKNTTGFIARTVHKAISPRFGIVYQPSKLVSVFASYTNSFSVNAGVDAANQPLLPSVIDQLEAGIKHDLFNGALSVNVTAYRIVNSNLAQTALFLADGLTPNNNSNIKELTGQTTSKGIEVDIMSKPINGFNLVAGYSYNDMRYTGVNNNTVNGNKLGDRLRYNPSHTANASVFYSVDKERKLKGFYLGAGAFYAGNRLAGRNPTNSPANTNKLFSLPDYVTVDVNAGYALNAFAVRLKLSNLFDEESYNAHDDNSLNPITPRQVITTLTYKF